MSKDAYEVYVVSVAGGDVLYVGQGKLGRHQHCNSGVSHVYGLNRLHFGKVEFKVEVVETFKTKAESEKREVELIKELNPKFNLMNNGDSSMRALHSRYYLDHLCHIKAKKSNGYLDDGWDDGSFWDDSGFDYLGMSHPLIFKSYGSYYMLDTEANEFDVNTKKLLIYKDLKFYNRSEVETFCVNFFLSGLDPAWRKRKATQEDLDYLLKDCMYRIEYS